MAPALRLRGRAAEIAVLSELLVVTQPAHLQRFAGRELTAAERNVYRAQVVRDKLTAAEHEASSTA